MRLAPWPAVSEEFRRLSIAPPENRTMTEPLPIFRYHPIPRAVIESRASCKCVGQARGFIYVGRCMPRSPMALRPAHIPGITTPLAEAGCEEIADFQKVAKYF
jgi:hypothetical protein